MTYDLLLSFGCSFTLGGGLNSLHYHKCIDSGLTRSKDLDHYMLEHSFPGYLSRQLGCDYINYGTSCAGNDFIFKKVYDTLSSHNTDKKVLVTIQSSILSRILLNDADSGESININGFDTARNDEQKQYYGLYVTKFFDEKKEYAKVMQQFDVYTTWLKSKNIDVVCLMHDTGPYKMPTGGHFIDFNGASLGAFISHNKLRLCDSTTFNDSHYSPQGNEIIANTIYQHLNLK